MRDITRLLHNARHGDPVAEERPMGAFTASCTGSPRDSYPVNAPNHTLQPTALVNETYLKLFGKKAKHWENRVPVAP